MCSVDRYLSYRMEWALIECDDCKQTYTVRIREGGTVVLTTEDQRCARCGGEAFSRIDG